MKASETKLMPLIEGKKQFCIPVYQRVYVWTTEECEQLWEDILSSGCNESVKSHFFGSIVYVHEGLYRTSEMPTLLIIDGQQRLTTITLILIALARKIEKMTKKQVDHQLDITTQEVLNRFILNPYNKEKQRYRLLLNENGSNDQATLIRLIEQDNAETSHHLSKNIQENYKFFDKKMADLTIDELKYIYDGANKLVVIDVSLDKTVDDPQRIFESLNSTGVALTQADLVRNYVMMDLDQDQQKELYATYWRKMERDFGEDNPHRLKIPRTRSYFDRFMRDYLTQKTAKTPTLKAIYQSFKTLIYEEILSRPDENQFIILKNYIADLYIYSQYFIDVASERESHEGLNQTLHNLNSLKVYVCYPFVLKVYANYRMQRLSLKTTLEILQIIEHYCFRRIICNSPTRTLDAFFTSLCKNDYFLPHQIENLPQIILEKTRSASGYVFPTDDIFELDFFRYDFYTKSDLHAYALRKLENYHHPKEPILGEYTTEHILPQNPKLSPEWQLDLGEKFKDIQKKYLHTVGNLTLTALNSEMGDLPYAEKIKRGFHNSPLWLNQQLMQNYPTWNEENIIHRGKLLSQLAVLIWKRSL